MLRISLFSNQESWQGLPVHRRLGALEPTVAKSHSGHVPCAREAGARERVQFGVRLTSTRNPCDRLGVPAPRVSTLSFLYIAKTLPQRKSCEESLNDGLRVQRGGRAAEREVSRKASLSVPAPGRDPCDQSRSGKPSVTDWGRFFIDSSSILALPRVFHSRREQRCRTRQ
jgi:hypothetical protein